MQNRHGELTIICKAKDLVNHTLQLTNNTKLFPKKVRFTLCQRMQNLSIQILHDIIAANEIYPRTVAEMNTRLDLQKEVLTNCKVFLNFLDIALEQGYIDIRRCEYWTGLTTDVKNLAASWRKPVRASPWVCLVRSPNSSNANNVRYVNSDGSLNNNNAYNGNRGVRPASVEYRDRVTRKGESRSPPSKEDVSGPGLTGQG